MRNLLLLLSLILVLAMEAPAQARKKAAAPAKKATKNMTVAPKLTDKEPLFAGFTGSFMKFGKVSGTSRPFTMTVEYSPWFFAVKGNVSAAHNTADLDILLENLVGVLAYYNAEGKFADGTAYQAAPFDFTIYLDDAPLAVTDVKVALVGLATTSSKIATQASTWNFKTKGEVFKKDEYYDALLTALAGPMDRSDIEREIAAEKKRVQDSIATEKQRVQDSIESIERKKREAIAREKRRKADSIAEIEALKEQARRKAAAAAARKKRQQMEEEEYYEDEYYDEEDEYYEEEEEYVPPKRKAPPRKKAPAKRKAPAKKRR